MTLSYKPRLRTFTQASAMAVASLVAAHAWRRLLRSAIPSYSERVTPAAWSAGS
jgi:hypothetical protein